MDFDPSQFLSMNITEDNEEITLDKGPDKESQPTEENEVTTMDKIVVTGGLQLEPVELPVPRFDTLLGNVEMIENNYGQMDANPYESMEVTVFDGKGDDSELSPLVGNESPGERANSPDDRIRRSIQTSYDEQRFRKEFFSGAYEKVKLFRLHCTSCDRHLGCAPQFTTHNMRAHKLLNLAVCRNCFEYYGNRNFPVEGGSEIYCCWCGEGGKLFCCSSCPKTVCKKCVKQNFGHQKVKCIEDNDNWQCFVCKPEDIYPHRAIYWAWQHLTKKMRQNLVTSPKEIKDILLSKDTSHCCSDEPIEISSMSLPNKLLMMKFPDCLIAGVHLGTVKSQPDQVEVKKMPVSRTVLNHGSSMNRDVGTVKMPVNRVTPQQTSSHKDTHIHAKNRQTTPGQAPSCTFHRSRTMPYQQPIVYQHPSHHQIMMHLPHQQKMMQPNLLTLPLNRGQPYPMPMPYQPPPHHPTPTQPRAMPNDLLFKALKSNLLQANTGHPRDISPFDTIHISQPQTVDLVDEDSPPTHRSSRLDISWLEQGLVGIKECINPIRAQLNQFNLAREDMSGDFSNLSNYVDKLSYNVKIAICQLAKINTNLQDAKKHALDNQVESVVSQLSGVTKKSRAIKITRRLSDNLQSVEVTPFSSKVPEALQPAPATPSSSKDEEMTLNPALLCEAIIESEVKKNVEVNKSDGVMKLSQKKRIVAKKKLSRPKKDMVVINIRKQIRTKLLDETKKMSCPFAEIGPRDYEKRMTIGFDAEFYCKKFKIKSCKVVLNKCEG